MVNPFSDWYNSLIDSLSQHQLNLKGFAWKFEMTVEEFLKATIGHEIHHIAIIKDKYLNIAKNKIG